jgi:DNA replication protein DnaC
MENLSEIIKRTEEGISRRRQASTELLEEWHSDPHWRPDCAACRKPAGLLPAERSGLRLLVQCPWRDDPTRCRLASADLESAAAAKIRWLRERGLGRRYHGMSLESVETNARPEIEAYLERLDAHVRAGRGLLLAGPVGSGKTAILGLIAERAYDLGIESVDFVHCSTLFAAFYRRGRDDAERLERWRSRSLLLLDDFGLPYAHDFPLAEFEAFCEHRHAEMQATCVTTNARVEELQASVEWARVYDRWRSTCWGYVLEGPSNRQGLEGAP